MGWKNVPLWLKLGIIFLVISLILFIRTDYYPLLDLFWTIIWAIGISEYLLKIFGVSCDFLTCQSSILTYFTTPIFFFLMGALFGLIITKVKNHRQKNNLSNNTGN